MIDSKRAASSHPPPHVAAATLNVAAYKFITFDDLETRRTRYYNDAQARQLRGTILLAEEGINLSLAGPAANLEAFMRDLQAHDPPGALEIKRSYSSAPPFGKLQVKLKREIVALKRPDIRPDRTPAPRVSPADLKAWLDAGRELLLLDTRNEFEIAHGSFVGARSLQLQSFSDLPARLETVDPAWKDCTVVTFCTGGIRCEKAAPLLIEAGFKDVVQLDGGILKYFEECGADHYSGTCFVFDERVALDDTLAPDAADDLQQTATTALS